jgi:hypothetical protein
LRQGDELWDALRAKLGALSDEQLARPGASGPQWSGKDVLAHIVHWHDHALEGIRAIVDGREPISRSDFDDWNTRWFTEDAALSAEQARDRCTSTREELRAYLAGLSAERWSEATHTWSDGVTEHIHTWADTNMNEHYRDHLDELAKAQWPD